MSASRILVLGASGFVGRQLAALDRLREVTWAGRQGNCPIPGYVAVQGYDDPSISALVREHQVIVLLAALTRGRRAAAMQQANVETMRSVVKAVAAHQPAARVIFLSSDLASYALSPYGESKRDAEQVLLGSGLDAVALRAGPIAGFPLAGLDSSMQKLKALSARPVVPAPGGGRFDMHPLWIEDLASILVALAQRLGRTEDRGLWRALGAQVRYDALIRAFAARAGTVPRIVNIPVPLLVAGGRLLAALNPDTRFPLDFFEVLGRPATHPPDLFAHLGLSPSEPAQYLMKI